MCPAPASGEVERPPPDHEGLEVGSLELLRARLVDLVPEIRVLRLDRHVAPHHPREHLIDLVVGPGDEPVQRHRHIRDHDCHLSSSTLSLITK
jgi:hypothetical protein